jgi:hypothetical protein
MYSNPIILPLDIDGTLYVLQDEYGIEIGTGSRKVCEVLMAMICKRRSNISESNCSRIPHRPNVRAAIEI